MSRQYSHDLQYATLPHVPSTAASHNALREVPSTPHMPQQHQIPHHHITPSNTSPQLLHQSLYLHQRSNSISTLSANSSNVSSLHRSPSLTPSSAHSHKRYSFSGHEHNAVPLPSSDQIFDMMEREQDAIVVKLMREIDHLKQENAHLKTSLSTSTNATVRRSSSLTSNRNSISSSSSASQPPTPSASATKRNSVMFSNYQMNPGAAASNDELFKKYKVEPPGVNPRMRSRNNSLTSTDQLLEENKTLKHEIKRLRAELDQYRS